VQYPTEQLVAIASQLQMFLAVLQELGRFLSALSKLQ